MPRHVFRIGLSLAAVLASYALYAVTVVPLIEPQARLGEKPAPVGTSPRKLPDQADPRLLAWFGDQPGAWELQNPKRLENEQGILLFRDYQTYEGGKLKIHPCTIIFLPHDEGAAATDRARQAVILQAPDGAILKFDRDFDIRRGNVGRLVGGLLLGKVTVRSDDKQPGPHDDLLISTHDVDLTQSTVSTPHPVQFRWGPNHGSGRGMQIEILPDEKKRGPSLKNGPPVKGLKSFTLRSQVQLHLQLEKGLAWAETQGVPAGRQHPDSRASTLTLPADSQTPQPVEVPRSAPIKIACRGPFLFDFVKQTATFEDQVDVLRLNLNGPSDQLTCEVLALYFREAAPSAPPAQDANPQTNGSTTAAAKKSPLSDMPKLELQRIEARGNPVVLSAPASAVYARGERLEYDLASGRVGLEDSREAAFRQESNEIRARQLQYQPGPDGRVGQFLADGGGWLSWEVTSQAVGRQPGQNDPAAPPRRFEASWSRRLYCRPHDGRQVISVEGAAKTRLTELGTLTAEEIHAWLTEQLPPADQPAAPAPAQTRRPARPSSKLIPDRMLATDNVRVDSPQLTGRTRRLEIWFTSTPANEPAAHPDPRTAATPIGTAGQRPAPSQSLDPRSPTSPDRRAAEPGSGQGEILSDASRAASSVQRFDATGDKVEAQVKLHDRAADITELRVTGSAQLWEAQTAQISDLPLKITGDIVQAHHANLPTARVTVSGAPAHVEGRGLTLEGAAIHLDRGANRVWIDGQGQLTLQVDRDLHGRTDLQPLPLEVTWQGRMFFDGQTATFERKVVGRRDRQRLNTETLEVGLLERVDFNNPRSSKRPELERIACREGVYLERQLFGPQGLDAVEQMRAADLSIQHSTGAIVASGPGWLQRVGRARGQSLLTLPGRPQPAAAASAEQQGLEYLHVSFQRGMSGNLHRREMTFADQVQSVYGQVQDWSQLIDPDEPEQLGERGVVVTCDQLTVAEMPGEGNERWLDLLAAGNTLIEGQSFTARGDRLTFSQEHELIILEGTSRAYAELWRQARAGARTSHAAARKIYYWRQSNRIKVEDARFLDLNQLPGENPLRRLPFAAPPTGGNHTRR